jgi:hypothetical protein
MLGSIIPEEELQLQYVNRLEKTPPKNPPKFFRDADLYNSVKFAGHESLAAMVQNRSASCAPSLVPNAFTESRESNSTPVISSFSSGSTELKVSSR